MPYGQASARHASCAQQRAPVAAKLTLKKLSSVGGRGLFIVELGRMAAWMAACVVAYHPPNWANPPEKPLPSSDGRTEVLPSELMDER